MQSSTPWLDPGHSIGKVQFDFIPSFAFDPNRFPLDFLLMVVSRHDVFRCDGVEAGDIRNLTQG